MKNIFIICLVLISQTRLSAQVEFTTAFLPVMANLGLYVSPDLLYENLGVGTKNTHGQLVTAFSGGFIIDSNTIYRVNATIRFSEMNTNFDGYLNRKINDAEKMYVFDQTYYPNLVAMVGFEKLKLKYKGEPFFHFLGDRRRLGFSIYRGWAFNFLYKDIIYTSSYNRNVESIAYINRGSYIDRYALERSNNLSLEIGYVMSFIIKTQYKWFNKALEIQTGGFVEMPQLYKVNYSQLGSRSYAFHSYYAINSPLMRFSMAVSLPYSVTFSSKKRRKNN